MAWRASSSSSPRKSGAARASATPSAKTPLRRSGGKGATAAAALPTTANNDASPMLDPNMGAADGMLLGLDGDESALLGGTSFNGRGMEGLSLMDSPVVPATAAAAPRTQRAAAAASTRTASTPNSKRLSSTARGSRPSWGPRASVTGGTASRTSPSKGKMRLLDGLEDGDDAAESNTAGTGASAHRERTLGAMSYGAKGQQRARQSIFARPAAQQQSSPAPKAGDAEAGDDSFYRNRAISTSSNSVKERVAAIESSRAVPSSSAAADVFTGGRSSALQAAQQVESSEGYDAQLSELKRLNHVFEAYEGMLQAGVAQAEDFSHRIADTNALLDMYIDLMKQAEKTQQLLLDTEWKGATAEDEAMRALEAELAERERQQLLLRQRQQEADEAARREAAAAQRAQLEAGAKTARANGPRTTTAAATAGRGARVPSRGIARGTSAAASTRGSAGRAGSAAAGTGSMRGRATSSSSTTPLSRQGQAGAGVRGPSAAATPASSTAGGLNNRYANVRSSGYGPR